MRAVDFSSQVCAANLLSQVHTAHFAPGFWVVSHTYFVSSFWSHLYQSLRLGLEKFGLNIAHGGWEYQSIVAISNLSTWAGPDVKKLGLSITHARFGEG